MSRTSTPRQYRVEWRTGQVEIITATYVGYPARGMLLPLDAGEGHIEFRNEEPEEWRLVLSVAEDQIKSIRPVDLPAVLEEAPQ